jgi:hypothetical protein
MMFSVVVEVYQITRKHRTEVQENEIAGDGWDSRFINSFIPFKLMKIKIK